MKRRNFISQLSYSGLGAMGIINNGVVFANTLDYNNAPSFASAFEDPIMISVKAIKQKPEFCEKAPSIQFQTSSSSWHLTSKNNDHGDFYGENIWEVYFNIETYEKDFTPSKLMITTPGVEIVRVIIGHTDVTFEQIRDKIHFSLIDDQSKGQLMQTQYQSPLGGYPISFIHNWEIRKAKEYAFENFPTLENSAVNNYLLAAQEVLRQMGDMGPGNKKYFKGNLVLMGYEIAATRGHIDYPPHFHLMHYEVDNSYTNWKSRLVPHFYMNKEGNIIRNGYAKLAGKGTTSGNYKFGDIVRFEDSNKIQIIDLIIDEIGLILRHPDGREYSIRPDSEQGASHAVYGYFNNNAICKSIVKDFPDLGVFRIALDVYENGKEKRTLQDGYLYDPFTAHKYRSFSPQINTK